MPDDVELASDANESGDFHTVAEVIGKETTCAVPAEKPLVQDELHAPYLVRRGEVVTVYARAAGIRIRTVARMRTTAVRASWLPSSRSATAARFIGA